MKPVSVHGPISAISSFLCGGILISSLFLCLVFGGDVAQAFGDHGSRGSKGSSGPSGRDGRDISIILAGQSAQFQLNGTDGGDGGNGGHGRPATDCRQTQPDYDISGADGGDGGAGGDGGGAGRGGDVTAFTADITHLKNLFIESFGGRSGRPGIGGQGGPGCQCSQGSWEGRECDTFGECTARTYRCSHGDYGSPGKTGHEPTDGRLGKLTLVLNRTSLESVDPLLNTTVGELANGSHEISAHVWKEILGAKALLADGSALSDTYSLYQDTKRFGIELVWLAPRSIEEFRGVKLTFNLVARPGLNDVQFSTEAGSGLKTRKEIDGHIVRVFVDQAWTHAELEQGKLEIQGKKQAAVLVFTDVSGALPYSEKTTIDLNVERKQLIGSKTLYSGPVELSKVEIRENTIRIPLIGIIEGGELTSGKDYTFTLDVSRELSGWSYLIYGMNLKQKIK